MKNLSTVSRANIETKSVLLIPAYKPDLKLIKLITQLREVDDEKIIKKIFIVNDGSGEKYQNIFKALEQLNNVKVLHHAINLGKGAALKSGFNHILIEDKMVTSIITADADGQHTPTDIIKIIKNSLLNPYKLILGVRLFNGKVPIRSLIGNFATRMVMRFFTGLNLTDTQTGLRAWPRSIALDCLKISINGYDFETETLVRFHSQSQAQAMSEKKYSILEIPIETVYEKQNKSSHFNPIIDSMRIYFVFFRYCAGGLITALVDNLVFITLFSIYGDIIVSQFFSRSSGALVSFFISKNIVFHSSKNGFKAIIKFSLLAILLGFVSFGVMQMLISNFEINVITAKIIAEFMLFVVSFLVQRSFIF